MPRLPKDRPAETRAIVTHPRVGVRANLAGCAAAAPAGAVATSRATAPVGSVEAISEVRNLEVTEAEQVRDGHGWGRRQMGRIFAWPQMGMTNCQHIIALREELVVRQGIVVRWSLDQREKMREQALAFLDSAVGSGERQTGGFAPDNKVGFRGHEMLGVLQGFGLMPVHDGHKSLGDLQGRPQ